VGHKYIDLVLAFTLLQLFMVRCWC